MTSSDLLHLRLVNQHLAQPDFKTPYDVVKWHGAMQSQDFYGGLWSVGLRMKSATEAQVEQDLIDGKIVRTWPMRGTWHFVAAEDIKWVLTLMAPRYSTMYGSYFRALGLTESVLHTTQEIIADALRGNKQLTRPELKEALEHKGIKTHGLRLNFIVSKAATSGLILNGPRRGKQFTFVLLDEWVTKHDHYEGDEALAEWAKRYFLSHGPATEYDFAWWSSVTVTQARKGIEMNRKHLHAEVVNGKSYYFATNSDSTINENHGAYLLQPYDEYVIAYKTKSEHLFDPRYSKPAQKALIGLIGQPIIVDRKVVGWWRRTLKKDTVQVEQRLFAPLDKQQQTALQDAAERYGQFIGKKWCY